MKKFLLKVITYLFIILFLEKFNGGYDFISLVGGFAIGIIWLEIEGVIDYERR